MSNPIIGGLTALAGATGIGAGVYGASKAKKAKDSMKSAARRYESNVSRYGTAQKACTAEMDKLGTMEMEILSSFGHFSDLLERIQNRPKFEEIDFGDQSLPYYDHQQLRDVSAGAEALLGSLGEAVAGTVGGMAAVGAASAAVTALGSASTGTDIAGLYGADLTNATLTLLGGGAFVDGGSILDGGPIVDGTLLLGALVARFPGVGLMVGGAIYAFFGSKLSEQADEAWSQMKRAEEKINTVCIFLDELKTASVAYRDAMKQVRHLYDTYITFLEDLLRKETDWSRFYGSDKQNIMNLVHLFSILYAMCKEKLVLKNEEEDDGVNTLNKEGISTQMSRAEAILGQIAPL